MQYIVLDLEWNQAMSPKASVYKNLPFPLAGEIIQIGAVKLNENKEILDELKVGVRPEYFTKMHYKVKKLTGISREQMSKGINFVSAAIKLMSWCGEDCTVLTWGRDDIRIMRQNLRIHGMSVEWPKSWIDLQLVYNLQTGGDKNQKALSAAMEHFGIEATRPAHDALGDAYHTALICARLDMEKGTRDNEDFNEQLRARLQSKKAMAEKRPVVEARAVFGGFESRAAAFSDNELPRLRCPKCGEFIVGRKWLTQDRLRYVNIFRCPEHGEFFSRLKFHREDDLTWTVTRLSYALTPEFETIYANRAPGRRRNRRGGLRAAAVSDEQTPSAL